MGISIRKVKDEYEDCADVIRKSFITVADEFKITRENAPIREAYDFGQYRKSTINKSC